METSILTSTKKMLNIGADDDSFDLDIVTHINSALSHLQQLGIGPPAGFQIEDASAEWSDFLDDPTTPILSAAKTTLFLHVRLAFDPPATPHVLASLERQIEQADWRLNVMREETEWVNPNPPPESMVIDGGNPSGE